MTPKQFTKKVKQMKSEVNKLIDSRIEKILNSGALPLDKYDNDFTLPKAFMSAMGQEIQWQFKPLDKETEKLSKKLALHL